MDYQMQKAVGKYFRTTKGQPLGTVRILGSWYDYKVIDTLPEKGDMLEVIDFTSRELLVIIRKDIDERDVNYIGDF